LIDERLAELTVNGRSKGTPNTRFIR
jgi:hypothetical protein